MPEDVYVDLNAEQEDVAWASYDIWSIVDIRRARAAGLATKILLALDRHNVLPRAYSRMRFGYDAHPERSADDGTCVSDARPGRGRKTGRHEMERASR
ncbi:hypothetical protein Atai01_30600 [Amycolatopsis taiwanensis]|uniref:Uncharacterized protein n=1 Tax=Amycolatopsis taiwanensis TaxID=342230 RepID=A0A9W6VHG1_9PSEU|nr:hypothetical protein Atai01_30600 [Amycolatopsis taiwanensis]